MEDMNLESLGVPLEKVVEVRRILKLLGDSTDYGKNLKKVEDSVNPLQPYLEELRQIRKFNEDVKGEEEVKESDVETIPNASSFVQSYNENVKNIIKYYVESTTDKSLENRLYIFRELIKGIKIKVDEILKIQYPSKEEVTQWIKDNVNIEEKFDFKSLNSKLNDLSLELSFLVIIISSVLKWYRAPITSDRFRLGGIFIHDFYKPIATLTSIINIMITAVNPQDEMLTILALFTKDKKGVIKLERARKDMDNHMDILGEFIEEELNEKEPEFTSYSNLRKIIDLNDRTLELTVNGMPATEYNFRNVEAWICAHTLVLNSTLAGSNKLRIEVTIENNITTVKVIDNGTGGKWPNNFKEDMQKNFELGFKYPDYPSTQSLRGGLMVAFLKGQEAGRKYNGFQVDYPKIMNEYIAFGEEADSLKYISVKFDSNTFRRDISG